MNIDMFEGDEPEPPLSPKQYAIQSIDKGVAAEMYKRFHYLGEKDFLCMYSFGALFNSKIWACISFGIPNAREINGVYQSDEQRGVLEIVRLVADPKAPRNTCSWLISRSIKALQERYPLRIVITYADTEQGHTGSIYKAANFEYRGLTAQKTDFVFPDGKIRKVKGVKYSELDGSWVKRSRKHMFIKRY